MLLFSFTSRSNLSEQLTPVEKRKIHCNREQTHRESPNLKFQQTPSPVTSFAVFKAHLSFRLDIVVCFARLPVIRKKLRRLSQVEQSIVGTPNPQPGGSQ